MHRALEIQEITLNIFGHCRWADRIDQSELAYLARSCRAFKESALDALWEELRDLSPLVRCLPEACHLESPIGHRVGSSRTFSLSVSFTFSMYFLKYRSFSRPLTQTEWDILQSYTRRIRRIMDFTWGLDEKAISILSNPPSTTGLLFPKLRYLCGGNPMTSLHLLHLPFPSLLSFGARRMDICILQDALSSLSQFSPNITCLDLFVDEPDVAINQLVSSCICRWKALQTVDIDGISLDIVALAHLSRMPTLSWLGFRQAITFPDPIPPLSFSHLCSLTLYSASLGPVSQFLHQIRLPVIRYLGVTLDSGYPSCQELSIFMACVQASNPGRTIASLSLSISSTSSDPVRWEAPPLCFADVQPCMAFANLHTINLDLECNVDLTDSDLLPLAVAWPNLQQFGINERWGWNSQGGITPNGLLQFLQTCRSLSRVVLLLDTRGYTELQPMHLNLELKLPPYFYLDVLDSTIQADSILPITAFFVELHPEPGFLFNAWSGIDMVRPPGWERYKSRWHDVYIGVTEAIGRRS